MTMPNTGFAGLRAATIGLLLAGAGPLLAQNALPPAAAAAPADSSSMMAGPHAVKPWMRGGRDGMRGGLFAGLSDAGRTAMRDVMKAGGDPRSDHYAVKAARDRMLVVLDADKLDVSALKRAMEDERKAAQIGHDRRQAAMLAGFGKLSAADRKAFVASARTMRDRMEARVGQMRGGRGPGAPGGDMPPPPPPM